MPVVRLVVVKLVNWPAPIVPLATRVPSSKPTPVGTLASGVPSL